MGVDKNSYSNNDPNSLAARGLRAYLAKEKEREEGGAKRKRREDGTIKVVRPQMVVGYLLDMSVGSESTPKGGVRAGPSRARWADRARLHLEARDREDRVAPRELRVASSPPAEWRSRRPSAVSK